jgi:hypothetical protein
MKRAIGFFIRAFIVTFCFIVDIKVHADIVVEAVNGQVDIEHDARNLDVNTFDGSTRFALDDKKVGVEKGSVFSVDKSGDGQLSNGNIFLSIPAKSVSFKIHTPQGDVEMGRGDFFIEVSEGKTQVSVLSGTAVLIDRASKKNFQIPAGYSTWLGGLLATGQHARPARPQACELTRIMDKIRPLMGWDEKEYQSRNKAAAPSWKDAVVKVAEDSQSAVDSDIKTLNKILESEKKREDKINHDQAGLRKLFREKTIGVPAGNTESPSEIDRDPASDLE